LVKMLLISCMYLISRVNFPSMVSVLLIYNWTPLTALDFLAVK
jgi:hypothetical protein